MKNVGDAVARACALTDRGRSREAFRVLLLAARCGDTSVFMNLGYAYDVGQGIRQSKRKALYWYRRAVSRGEGAAAHNIATVFRDRGDIARALRWLERAVALGDSGSNLERGELLMACFGQPREALACFKAVGPWESEADIEAAKTWAAVAEGMLASTHRQLEGRAS